MPANVVLEVNPRRLPPEDCTSRTADGFWVPIPTFLVERSNTNPPFATLNPPAKVLVALVLVAVNDPATFVATPITTHVGSDGAQSGSSVWPGTNDANAASGKNTGTIEKVSTPRSILD
jgi:hypothetical protein